MCDTHHVSQCDGQVLGGPHHLGRLFIISDLADSPDLPMTTERLLQNQVDIGNAIKPYYGDAAGDQLPSPDAPSGYLDFAPDLT